MRKWTAQITATKWNSGCCRMAANFTGESFVNEAIEQADPIWVRPKKAAKIGGFGLTRCYELMNSGKLKSVRVDGMRLVSVESIRSLGEAT
jgi:hypothetical protein